MLGRLLLLFTLVPIAELLLLVQIGQVVGMLATVAIVITTGVAGAWLARVAGLRVVGRIQSQLAEGRLPADELIDGALVLGAGFMLLTPGVLTDLCALALLTPPGRAFVRVRVKARIARAVTPPGPPGTVTIDVEARPRGPREGQ